MQKCCTSFYWNPTRTSGLTPARTTTPNPSPSPSPNPAPVPSPILTLTPHQPQLNLDLPLAPNSRSTLGPTPSGRLTPRLIRSSWSSLPMHWDEDVFLQQDTGTELLWLVPQGVLAQSV